MVKEAEQFADEDKKRRAAAEAKNQAESLIHSTEQQLKEHGDKVDATLKTEIEAALAEAKTAVEGGDADAMTGQDRGAGPGGDEARPGDVRAAAGRRRREPKPAQSAEATAEASAGDEEVVDAEFSEVDEEQEGLRCMARRRRLPERPAPLRRGWGS